MLRPRLLSFFCLLSFPACVSLAAGPAGHLAAPLEPHFPEGRPFSFPGGGILFTSCRAGLDPFFRSILCFLSLPARLLLPATFLFPALYACPCLLTRAFPPRCPLTSCPVSASPPPPVFPSPSPVGFTCTTLSSTPRVVPRSFFLHPGLPLSRLVFLHAPVSPPHPPVLLGSFVSPFACASRSLLRPPPSLPLGGSGPVFPSFLPPSAVGDFRLGRPFARFSRPRPLAHAALPGLGFAPSLVRIRPVLVSRCSVSWPSRGQALPSGAQLLLLFCLRPASPSLTLNVHPFPWPSAASTAAPLAVEPLFAGCPVLFALAPPSPARGAVVYAFLLICFCIGCGSPAAPPYAADCRCRPLPLFWRPRLPRHWLARYPGGPAFAAGSWVDWCRLASSRMRVLPCYRAGRAACCLFVFFVALASPFS